MEERVLIVSKTLMGSQACVGGLTFDTNQSVRLLTRDGSNQSAYTSFEIGTVWDLCFHKSRAIHPPHVEDVIVTSKKYRAKVQNMRSFLMPRVQPWCGGLDVLFDGLLTIVPAKSCYIARSDGIPRCSTGYWLPDKPLTLENYQGNKPYYRFPLQDEPAVMIKYVGFASPIPEIAAHTLVRVSLARWWDNDGRHEERCYFQISGWYL
jgi:hypothetical protein